MSPSVMSVRRPLMGFPRVSGDEPYAVATFALGVLFSPRERG